MKAIHEKGFADYRSRVFRYYEEKRYAEALAVASEASERFPDYYPKTAFWTACLQSRLGRIEDAVRTLQNAVKKGVWWPAQVLQDHQDLELIRKTPAFKAIEAECMRLKRGQPKQTRPELLVRTPAGYSTRQDRPSALMVLHQRYGENPELSAEPWASILASGTLLAAPWSSQVYSSDGRCWDDLDVAENDVRFAFSELNMKYRFDHRRFVLGGFSQGGALSIYCALSRVVPSRGFVAVAPSDWIIPEPPATERKAASEAFQRFIEACDCRGLRGVVIIGDKDAFFPKIEPLYRRMLDKGLDGKLIVEPGLGHAYPHPFETELNKAVNFVLVDPERY